jgi:hypothetical protein
MKCSIPTQIGCRKISQIDIVHAGCGLSGGQDLLQSGETIRPGRLGGNLSGECGDEFRRHATVRPGRWTDGR